MKNTSSIKSLISILFILTPLESYAIEKPSINISAGVEYSTGDYGTDQNTDIIYVPVILNYEKDKLIYNLTVPYISSTGVGIVTKGMGRYKSIITTSTIRTTESGLGDIIGNIKYNLINDINKSLWRLDLGANIKIGTADKDKNLGTGENDYSVQIDVYKYLNEFTGFITIGENFYGNPSGVSLDNAFYISVGGNYKFTDLTSGGLVLDYTQKVNNLASEQNNLSIEIYRKLSDIWQGKAYLSKGFSDGSPDSSVGAMLTRHF